MRTEADLVDAIEALASEAPSREDILAGMKDRRRRRAGPRRSRPWLVPAAAAAVVLAIVAALATAGVFRGSRSSQAPATAGPTGRYPCQTVSRPSFDGFAIGPVPDLSNTISSVESCAGYRSVRLFTTSGGYVGDIVLYAAGVFDTALLDGARKVTGSGITGYDASVPPASSESCASSSSRPAPVSGCTSLPALVWQYAPHAWAAMTRLDSGGGVSAQFFGSDPISKQLSIAATVRPAVRLPILTPFRIANLSGLRPLAANGSARPAGTTENDAGAQLDLAVPGSGTGCPSSAACTSAVIVGVESTVSASLPLANFPGPRFIIGSTTGVLSHTGGITALRFVTHHWSVIITIADAAAGVTTATLVRIARSMSFAASHTDTSTWHTFAQALPR